MKYSLCIATIICILTITLTTAKEDKHFNIPNAGKIAHEYLVQNTVNFAKKNGIFQSDIDKNPGKYHILNGLTAAEDNINQNNGIYANDTTPYYDPTKPQAVAPKPIPDQISALNRYKNQIYPLDTVPYYGPSKPFRHIVNGGGNDHFAIPAKIGNLEERTASQKNIDELKKQLDKLNDWIEGPKYMSHDDKGREVYFKDAKAYYDPTMLDKRAQRAKLQAQIKSLTNEMNDSEKPTLIVGKMKSSLSVQNFVNTNKEETNEFIANSYYYPVDKSTLANRQNNQNTNLRTITNNNNLKKVEKNQAINMYTRKPEKIIIGSVDKYYDSVKGGLVEAESTGVTKADKRFYYEDSAAAKSTVKKPETNIVQNATKDPIQTATKAPNTQGLKTGGFRILSMRKSN